MISSSKDKRLLVLIALFLFFLFSLLIVQFYKIQIVEGKKWQRIAEKQHRLVLREPSHRGVFYSNTAIKKGHPEKLQPFVIDVPHFHLYADPVVIPSACRKTILQKLQQILNLSDKDREKVLHQLLKKSRSRKLVVWLTRDMHDRILQWWNPFSKSHKIPRNALFFVHDYKRSYPFGSMLGQLLHTIRSERDATTHQCIPTGGLELFLNKYLKGEDGKRIILRSPRQPLDTGKVVTEPKHGADVYLTINHHLQAIAEEEIAKAVKNAGAKGGWAIMMHPSTGEIFAWAQYPFFEPLRYRDYFNDPKKEEYTKVKAITDAYEPGSTMKALTLAVCLKANDELIKQGKPPLFSPFEKILTLPAHFPGRGKPLKDLHTHHFLNMYMALQKSSNVYMAKMIQRVIERLGDRWYRQTLEQIFGMGVKTGIELPAESSGLLPTPGKKHPNGKIEWSKATPPSLAMGHNVMLTTLQLLLSYGVLANGGFEVQPTLIRKIVGNDGNIIYEKPHKISKQLLEPTIVKEVVRAMRFVTKPGGTARRGNIPFYTEACKTGTSEKIVGGVYSKKNHISFFVGFAPVSDPCFVLVIAIDEPEYKYIPGVGKNQHGGICAAPAFREIGLRTLQFLGIKADDPNDKAWDDEVQKLKKLYDQWN